MSRTYDRVFTHIDKSRLDCMNRIKVHNKKVHTATIMCLLELSCMMINEALEIKTRSLA